MADARSVAKFLIDEAQKKGHGGLTPMQLLKLTYIAHGYSLGLRSIPLVDNRIEAWKFGPVIPDLYHGVKDFRDRAVHDIPDSSPDDLNKDEKALVGAVFEAYGDMSGIALSNLTHEKDTPWAKVYRHNVLGIKIPNDLIEEHYQEILEP
jgi:uncharacterized phage-associated protein